jgi:hypothetical protein
MEWRGGSDFWIGGRQRFISRYLYRPLLGYDCSRADPPKLDKSIQYERDLNATATWLAKSMGVASDQGPGDNNEMDNQHMDVIRTKLINFGYNPVDQLYDPTATSTQVTNAINEGRGFVNYCGHGSTTSWGTTGFSIPM